MKSLYTHNKFGFILGQTKRDKLVLQEWWFCGWFGNPPKENKVLISKDGRTIINKIFPLIWSMKLGLSPREA